VWIKTGKVESNQNGGSDCGRFDVIDKKDDVDDDDDDIEEDDDESGEDGVACVDICLMGWW
jgi:hypothetical protein